MTSFTTPFAVATSTTTSAASAVPGPTVVSHGPVATADYRRAPLRFLGSKGCLAKHIMSLAPDNLAQWTWVEPFLGSGALFLNAPKCHRYVLSDLNRDLVDLYYYAQTQPTALMNELCKLFVEENDTPEQFKALRAAFNAMPPSLERSALLVWLNQAGFKGLVRYNRHGQYNASYGGPVKPRLPVDELRVLNQALASGAEVTCCDFEDTLRSVQSRSIVLLDCPYLSPEDGSGGFDGYTSARFDLARHEALATHAARLARDGHWVIAFNNDSRAARHLHSRASELHTWPTYRRVAARATGRKEVRELAAVYKPTRLHTGAR